MPEKANDKRNNIGTARAGDEVVEVSTGATDTPVDAMLSMPDGIVGFEATAASATVYLHGTVNSTAPSTKLTIAASGVVSTYKPCARAAKLWISTNPASQTVSILPIVGIAES